MTIRSLTGSQADQATLGKTSAQISRIWRVPGHDLYSISLRHIGGSARVLPAFPSLSVTASIDETSMPTFLRSGVTGLLEASAVAS